MTFIGKMILIGLGGVTSTTGTTLLIVNKDKLFGISEKVEGGKEIPKNDKKNTKHLETNRDNGIENKTKIDLPKQSQKNVEIDAVEIQSINDLNSNTKSNNLKDKDYSCKFDGTYDEKSNKKKIKSFLESAEWSTKVNGIQILGEQKNDFTCAKDMDDKSLEGLFEYLSTNSDVKSGLTNISGREREDDNVIALRKNGGNWTIFGRDNEGDSEEVLSPIKKNNS